MRTLSLTMLDRLEPRAGATCLDLACGTGFVTGELARRTGGRVVGVDASGGMIEVARAERGACCTFVQDDVAAYLRSVRSCSVDVVTCAWALGYAWPWSVVREAARVLRPGGRIGIIDNSLFSLAGVLWASVLAFAERPEALAHVMRVHFLPGGWALALLMRMAGFAVRSVWEGDKTYHVLDGDAAIVRLRETGAAAGFEFAVDESYREIVFDRFARTLEDLYSSSAGIPVTHRFLAAVGHKR